MNKKIKSQGTKRKSKKNDRNQIILWINALTLFAFIGFSIWQSCLTRQALERADSANANAQKSNILAESSFVFTKRTTTNIIDLTEKEISLYKQSSDSAYDIAKKTMEAQIETSRTDLRPYLCFNEQVTNKEVDVGAYKGTYSIDLVIKNYGKTPAFDMTILGGLFFRKDFTNELFPVLSDTIKQGAPILAPGVDFYIPVSSKKNIIDQKMLDLIYNNKIFIFIFIKLNYNQHVGNKIIKHFTKFCVYFNPQNYRISPYDGVDSTRKGFDSDK